MPLNSHIEWPARIVDGFDHPVRRPTDYPETTRIRHRLTVVGDDGLASCPKFGRYHRILHLDEDRMMSVGLVDVGIGQRVGKVLVQTPTMLQSHQLHTQTNPQHGLMAHGLDRIKQRQFECLPALVHRPGMWVSSFPKWFRARIRTPREQQAITQ